MLLAGRLPRVDGPPAPAAGARISPAFRVFSGDGPARAPASRLAARAGRPEREAFADELRVWDVAGYFYGRHIYTLARFSPVKSRRRGESAAFAAVQREA